MEKAAGFRKPAASRMLFCVFLGFQDLVCLVVVEDLADHILVVPEHGLAVVIVTPALAVGLGIAVEYGDAFRLGMDGGEGILLFGGGLGA